MSSAMERKKSYKVEMVPPDGGWGYAVCVGLTIIFTASTLFTNSFGMMVNDFVANQNDSSKILTSVMGTSGMMMSLSGMITNSLKRYFSLRQLCIVGSVCFTLGWFLNIYISSVNQMLLTNGVLNGIGWGLIMTISHTTFSTYFVKKRVLMMSICMSIVGFVSIFGPFVIKSWLNEYGFKGMMALVAAVSANTILGSMLYQPVEWHLVPKVSEYTIDEKQEKGDMECMLYQNKKNVFDIEPKESLGDKSNETELVPMVTIKNNDNVSVTLIDMKKTNINDINDFPVKRSTWEKISKKLDLDLFRIPSYRNVCYASVVGIYSDLQFYMLQPLLLFEYGFSQSEVATCVSITSIADLLARIFLAVLTHFVPLDSRHIYYSSLIVSTIGRLAFPQFRDFTGAAIITGVLGFSRGLLYIPMPLLIADVLPLDKYVAAYGLTLLVSGVSSAILSPIAGLIKDLTGSFVFSFYYLGCTGLIGIIPWTLEFIRTSRKNKTT